MTRERPSTAVVVVTSRLDRGGAERHLARVLPELKRRGVDVTLYAMERGGPLEQDLLARGVRIEGPRLRRFLHWPRGVLELARWLRRERPTIVHFFLPRPYIFGSIAAEIAGHRRRLMSRRSLSIYQKRYPIVRLAERLLHRRTAGLLANSRAVLRELKSEAADARKLAIIYNGVEMLESSSTHTRQKLRSSLKIADDALTITVVANLIAYKGHRDLLHALASIKNDLPHSWTLLAIGRDEGIGCELRQTAEKLNIAENILWLGERSAVESILPVSDLFVLPSHEEGFSNALLEAMAARLPIIATGVGGNLDAIVNGESGLLVPVKEPKALAGAILRLARDPVLRERLGTAARHRVEQFFSLDACVDRYETLYRAMSESFPPPLATILGDQASPAGQRSAHR